jgi:hypothetical protein
MGQQSNKASCGDSGSCVRVCVWGGAAAVGGSRVVSELGASLGGQQQPGRGGWVGGVRGGGESRGQQQGAPYAPAEWRGPGGGGQQQQQGAAAGGDWTRCVMHVVSTWKVQSH